MDKTMKLMTEKVISAEDNNLQIIKDMTRTNAGE